LKRKIGYLSGETRLYNKWTGWEHIRFVEKIRGKSKILNTLVKKFNFNPKVKFKHLSSGN
jgi:ABC-type multidrug transport system ATPase subunit